MDRSISGAGDGVGARPTAHELARYEALFASRTRAMKSSAMREMMALTERPDVISLAGGLPEQRLGLAAVGRGSPNLLRVGLQRRTHGLVPNPSRLVRAVAFDLGLDVRHGARL